MIRVYNDYVIAEDLKAGDKISTIDCMGCGVNLIVKEIQKGESGEYACPKCGNKQSFKALKNGTCRQKNLS